MNIEKLNKFIEFCDSQPKDRHINHNMWSTCAVGDYARVLEVPIPDWTTEAKVLTGMGTELAKLVGSLREDEANTYGEFTEFLKTHL